MENIINELIDTFDDVKWKIDQIDYISCDIASELCDCEDKMDGLLGRLKEQLKFVDPKLFGIKNVLELGVKIRGIDFKYNIVKVETEEDLKIAADFYQEEIKYYDEDSEELDYWASFVTDNGIIFNWN